MSDRNTLKIPLELEVVGFLQMELSVHAGKIRIFFYQTFDNGNGESKGNDTVGVYLSNQNIPISTLFKNFLNNFRFPKRCTHQTKQFFLAK